MQVALYSRGIVLKAAADHVMETSSRSVQPASGPAVAQEHFAGELHSVLLQGCSNTGPDATSLAAGALVVLQEAGDVQTVLSWGDAWLAVNPDQPGSSDVVLAVALAYCDLAAANLDKSPDSVLTCVELMQSAQGVLRQHQTAPELDAQIASALEVTVTKPAEITLSL